MNNYSYAYPGPRNHSSIGKQYDSIIGKTTALPENPVPAMSYVPFQTTFSTYDEAKALKVGTLFPCLDKPFLGSGAR